jgi:hypothetical protein
MTTVDLVPTGDIATAWTSTGASHYTEIDEDADRPAIIRERSLEGAETIRFMARGGKPSFLRKRLIRSKDPSLTGRIENDYAKELDKLFVSVKRDVAKLLGRRELSDDWDEIDAPDLMEEFDRVIEVTITIPGKGVVKKFTTRAYTQGGLRSSQFLSSLGIKAVFSILPADRNALNILVTRDLSGLQGITDEMSKQIMAEITDGMLRGDSMDKVARAIDDRIDSIGRTRAEALARTETMKAYNEGASGWRLLEIGRATSACRWTARSSRLTRSPTARCTRIADAIFCPWCRRFRGTDD